jgi:hypothetical protein
MYVQFIIYLPVETFGKQLQMVISICDVVIQQLLVLSVEHAYICWSVGLSKDEMMQGKDAERSARSIPGFKDDGG